MKERVKKGPVRVITRFFKFLLNLARKIVFSEKHNASTHKVRKLALIGYGHPSLNMKIT